MFRSLATRPAMRSSFRSAVRMCSGEESARVPPSGNTLNRVELIGNLGQDATVTELSNGMYVTALNLATNERWKDKETEEWQQRTEWHSVKVFGRNASPMIGNLQKGDKIYVNGSLRKRRVEENTYVDIVSRGNPTDIFLLSRSRNADSNTSTQGYEEADPRVPN